MDAVGASETGSQMSHVSAAGQAASTGTFSPGPGAAIVSDDLTHALEAGHDVPSFGFRESAPHVLHPGSEAGAEHLEVGLDGVRDQLVQAPGDLDLLEGGHGLHEAVARRVVVRPLNSTLAATRRDT